ncbi:MAG: bifunctional phosphoribosyl-AMP cyclohydrolase/phosphoribosyl-ATP diphosphatase HisIE [Candidatus Micrarchaeota archaeon]
MIRFNKNGLVPIIIQDANTKQVLSLFYANEASIQKMKETGFVYRYSRSKGKVMKKGGESGNVQKVVEIIEDCDSDALLVLVEPRGPACHKNTTSCFEDSVFASPILERLGQIIEERKKNPKEGSYTCKLLADNELLKSKLMEELDELINFKDKDNLAWEAADLIYFIMVFIKKNNRNIKDVEKELEKRMLK